MKILLTLMLVCLPAQALTFKQYKKMQEADSETEVVSSLNTVIESQIDGEFSGWEGDTVFKLTNGQIWQQDEYSYTYTYKYRPDVIIFKDGGSYKMQVDGKNIRVKRLK